MANDILIVVWAAFAAACMVAGGAIVWRRMNDYWKARRLWRRVIKEINSDLDTDARIDRLWGRLRADTLPDLSLDDEPTLPRMPSNSSKVVEKPKVS